MSVALPTFASLPWYDFREVRPATDTFWGELARQLTMAGVPDVPTRLNRDVPYERQWMSAGFLFGQACGYDVRIAHAKRLQVVATPCYDVPGCTGSMYSSFIVVREHAPFRQLEGLRDRRCVINTPTSHSGMNVLRALVAPLNCGGRFFSDIRISGSHETSLQMVRSGQVDVAAIDVVTYAMLARNRPVELEGCRILHRTQHVPAPPFVTAASTPSDVIARMRESLERTFASDALADARKTLCLSGLRVLDNDAYRPIEAMKAVACVQGYHEFATVSSC